MAPAKGHKGDAIRWSTLHEFPSSLTNKNPDICQVSMPPCCQVSRGVDSHLCVNLILLVSDWFRNCARDPTVATRVQGLTERMLGKSGHFLEEEMGSLFTSRHGHIWARCRGCCSYLVTA